MPAATVVRQGQLFRVRLPANRDRELLTLLHENDGANYEFFATEFYGSDTPPHRANIASKFSHLKRLGYVAARGPGDFVLTEKGLTAIGQK